MNELHDARLDDDQVIARLRAALDEVTAESNTDELVPAEPQDHTMTAGRWMAVAAAMVLAVGAVAVIAINRSHAPDVASTPTETVAPTTTGDSSTTLPPSLVSNWYVLSSPDLIPEPSVTESCCASVAAPGPNTVMAWAATTGVQDGVFLLLSQQSSDGTATVKYMSYGLSDARTEELKNKVTPGSGLPYVLPDDSMELIGFGLDGMGNQTSQRYTNSIGAVTIAVGDYRGQLTPLVLGGGFDPVAIAGTTGYKYIDGGVVRVVWRTPAGQWATLEISPGLADRADDLIAAVTEQVGAGPTPTVETVPVPDTVGASDATVAVGDLAPTVSGETLTGDAVSFRSEGSVLLVFVQPACTPCAAVLSGLASSAASPSFPVGPRVELVIQPPAARAEVTAWLSDNHWSGDVILDQEGLTSHAFAVAAVPRYVLIGDSGFILAIHDGALDADGLKTLITPQSPTVLGSFDIPTVATSFSIVDASGYTQSVVLDIGPSLIRGPSPSTPGSALDTSVVVATRSTFGTDALIDLVKVGNRLTWTGPNGTQIYEVVWTEVCTGAGCGTTDPYTLIIELADGPDRIYAKPAG